VTTGGRISRIGVESVSLRLRRLEGRPTATNRGSGPDRTQDSMDENRYASHRYRQSKCGGRKSAPSFSTRSAIRDWPRWPTVSSAARRPITTRSARFVTLSSTGTGTSRRKHNPASASSGSSPGCGLQSRSLCASPTAMSRRARLRSTATAGQLVGNTGGREGFEPDSDPQSDQLLTDSEENLIPDDPLKSP
jgi:hypothetical protein